MSIMKRRATEKDAETRTRIVYEKIRRIENGMTTEKLKWKKPQTVKQNEAKNYQKRERVRRERNTSPPFLMTAEDDGK